MTIGDRISKRGLNGTVLSVVGSAAGYFTAAMDDGTVRWFAAGQSEIIASAPDYSQGTQNVALPEVLEESMPVSVVAEEPKEKQRVRAPLSEPLPYSVSSLFIGHLKKSYKLRLLYREESERYVKDWFNENQLSLPTDIRPVKSKMASVAGTLAFPTPDDTSFLPPTLHYISRGKNLEVNDVRLVVALMKLGFEINSYAKKQGASK